MTAALYPLSLLLTAGAAIGPGARIQPPRPPRHPVRLVVLVAVDQFRADYLRRWAAQFTGGLARLLREGVVYEHAHQEHAITETAPGHATMLSGREPAHTGIVTNWSGVPDATSPVLGVAHDSVGASPRRFRGTELYDWMRATDSAARVLSVSRKDRGAILPVGRARGDVYWYRGSRFTTSRYYADSLPAWVTAFNARRGPERLAGTRWTPLLPVSAYAEPDTMAFENGGHDVAFPHPLPVEPDEAARLMPWYPWMDSLTLDLALDGVRHTGVGRGTRTDLLSISLSTTDEIGHDFGPDSRELHDQVLRVDHWLGWFLDSLAVLVPRDRTLLVFTADHGVTRMPEYTAAVLQRPAGRAWLGDLASSTGAPLRARFAMDFGLRFDSGLLEGDISALRARGVNVDSLAESLARAARRRPGVAKVFTARSLRAAPAGDIDALRWRRQLPDDYGWLICAVPEPGWIWSRPQVTAAEHGSPLLDDVEVPIVFLGPGVRPRRVTRVVRTVDIAPTLAALLAIRPTERLDGIVLQEVAGAH